MIRRSSEGDSETPAPAAPPTGFLAAAKKRSRDSRLRNVLIPAATREKAHAIGERTDFDDKFVYAAAVNLFAKLAGQEQYDAVDAAKREYYESKG